MSVPASRRKQARTRGRARHAAPLHARRTRRLPPDLTEFGSEDIALVSGAWGGVLVAALVLTRAGGSSWIAASVHGAWWGIVAGTVFAVGVFLLHAGLRRRYLADHARRRQGGGEDLPGGTDDWWRVTTARRADHAATTVTGGLAAAALGGLGVLVFGRWGLVVAAALPGTALVARRGARRRRRDHGPTFDECVEHDAGCAARG